MGGEYDPGRACYSQEMLTAYVINFERRADRRGRCFPLALSQDG